MSTAAIPGAHHVPHDGAAGDLDTALERRAALLEAGVSFPSCPPDTVPWLVALEPFTMDQALTEQVVDLGTAVYDYIDAVQALYAEGHPVVRQHLDLGTDPDLVGLELDRGIRTFRLDLVVEQGRPVITEIEEIYGNAGKAHAMQRAYGVDYDGLFAFFAGLDLSHILVDDQVRTYDSELALVRRRLRDDHGQDIRVEFLSRVRLNEVKAAWRFCYTRDLGQYPADRRAGLVRSGIWFCNPLFHGYGTKLLVALAHHPDVADRLSPRTLATLRQGIAGSRLLEPEADVTALVEHRRDRVVKVVDSPGDRTLVWGSRGIYFGESSRTKWTAVLRGVRGGHLPDRPAAHARYMVTRLVESDRFDMPFLHPDGRSTRVLPRARLRLAPIFVREPSRVRLVAGHATFVNTSRKVHLGRHAVCAPLDWWRG